MTEVPHHDVPDEHVDDAGLPEELTGEDLEPAGEPDDSPDPADAGATDETEIPDLPDDDVDELEVPD